MDGEVVGSYCLDKKLGEGGMGVVYRAKHTVLGKLAAIKLMRPQLCADEESVTRFFNEAVLTANIRHPGIVEIFDYGVHERSGSAFITMELLEGESLESRLESKRRLSLVDSLRIAQQIASALAAAHRAGVVHRDLKPDNVFLTPDPDLPGGERIQLLDFGIAKLLDEEQQATSLTQTGTMIGTPLYMSPEQCRGRADIDGRTDLYALGCMLYRMLSGLPPFTGGSPLEVAAAHLRDVPKPLHLQRAIPRPVSDLVDELLAKRREDRPRDAAVLHRRLGKLLATVDTVKGIYDRPGDPGPDPAKRGDAELGHAATVATDSVPAAVKSSRRRRAALAAAGLAVASVGAALASRAVSGGDHSLAIEIAMPKSCVGLPVEACRQAAWSLALGDGAVLDRAAAAEMFRDACAAGSGAACEDVLEVDRRYLVPRDSPHFGDPGAGYMAYLVVDFADPGLKDMALGVWERLRSRFPGELALVLTPSGDSPESERAARAACAVHKQRGFLQFLAFHDLIGGPRWTDEQLGNQAWGELDRARLIDDYNGWCKWSVDGKRQAMRDIAAPPGTLFIEGYKIPPDANAVHNLELVAQLLDRFIARMGERESRLAESQRPIQATVRYPIDAGGTPAPVTLVSVCDPARSRCEMMRSIAIAQGQVFGARTDVLTIAIDPHDSLPARTLCAADQLEISDPVLEHISRIHKSREAKDGQGDEPGRAADFGDASLRPVIEKAGASFAAFVARRDGPCVAAIAEARARLKRAGAPLDVALFVNGRPARILGTPSHALIREELQLAGLLGYGNRVASADYYKALVSGELRSLPRAARRPERDERERPPAAD